MSYDIIHEDVPAFSKRVGDRVIHGSNNTIMILGTDRAKNGPANISDGIGHVNAPNGGKNTGTIHIIAGRNQENPDLDKDKAYLYLSMKTRADENLNTMMEGNSGEVSAAVIKSDVARIVVRKDIKIAFDNENSYIHLNGESCTIKIKDSGFIKITKDKIVIDSSNIELGEGAVDRILRGDAFKKYFLLHKHPTGTGLSGPPIDPWIDNDLMSQRKVTVS